MARKPAAAAAPAAAPAKPATPTRTRTPVTPAAPVAPEPAAVEPPPVEQPEVEVTEATIYATIMENALSIEPAFAAQHLKESANDYFNRLMLVLSKLSDEQYNAMPEPVQVWYNKGADAISNGKMIDHPEGYEAPVAPAPAASGRKGNTDALAAHRAKVAADKAAGIVAAPKAPKPPAAPRAEGVVSILRKAICANFAITNEQLVAHGATLGYTVNASTASTIRSDTVATLEILKGLGKLK